MRFRLTFFLLVAFFKLNAQLFIDFPYKNMVIQRDLTNKGTVLVTGFSTEIVDNIQVRFIPIKNNWGTQKDWENCNLLKSNNRIGFTLTTTLTGGWYKIEVKGLLNNKIVHSAQLDAFGVGEVFIIAGQSNAQGQSNAGEKDAEDERVVIIGGYDSNLSSSPNYNFFKMLSYFSIYPVGNGAWCWSELGDKLVDKLNVPVLFLNTGWGGSSSFDWADSIENNVTRPENPSDVPYFYLKKTLQYYANTIGFRAVLWHQGEADNGLNFKKYATTTNEYFENIKKVIESTRKQTGFQLSWVISKVSYGLGNTSESVIAAQEKLINEIDNVFLGPSTDDLKDLYRLDNLHFSNKSGKTGLTALANRWNEALTLSFFETSKPKTPNFGKNIFLDCENKSTYPVNHSEKNWGNIYNSHSFLVDLDGNYFISKFVADLRTLKPTIESNSSTVCEKNKAKLSVLDSFGYSVLWSNGLTGNEIYVSYPGTYYATLQNVGGCILNLPSKTITLNDETSALLPQSPSISSLNTTLVCEQNPAILKVITPENYEVVWNTGHIGSELTVYQKGEYYSFFREKNGCKKSPNSAIFQVKDISSVSLPPIIKNKLVACENDSIELKVKTDFEILWNNEMVSNPLIVKSNGDYKYRIKAQNNCITGFSKTEKINFLEKPKPIIKIERTNLFELTANVENNAILPFIEWTLDNKTLTNTSTIINISSAGLYKAIAYYKYSPNLYCYSDSNFSNEFQILNSEFEKSYYVYPNPLSANNSLNISRLTTAEYLKISIVTLEGKVVLSNEFNNGNSFSLIIPQPGNYIIKIEDKEGKSYSQRVLVR